MLFNNIKNYVYIKNVILQLKTIFKKKNISKYIFKKLHFELYFKCEILFKKNIFIFNLF